MRRALLVVAIMVVLLALFWEFFPIYVEVWDGHFDLTVQVSSPLGRLGSVSCEAFGARELAEQAVENLYPPDTHLSSAVANPFDGQPLTVTVPLSGRKSPVGRELRRHQFQYLAVIGRLENGKKIGKLVEIPDCRVAREIDVSLP